MKTLWQYALRFRVEELCLASKSGAFELEDSHLRSVAAPERLDLVAAIAMLYANWGKTSEADTKCRIGGKAYSSLFPASKLD